MSLIVLVIRLILAVTAFMFFYLLLLPLQLIAGETALYMLKAWLLQPLCFFYLLLFMHFFDRSGARSPMLIRRIGCYSLYVFFTYCYCRCSYNSWGHCAGYAEYASSAGSVEGAYVNPKDWLLQPLCFFYLLLSISWRRN